MEKVTDIQVLHEFEDYWIGSGQKALIVTCFNEEALQKVKRILELID